jgi:L-fucose isomerase-like protein
MEVIRIGFVPGKRNSRSYKDEWAMDMKRRVLTSLSAIEGLAIVTPDENLTQAGTVRCDEDARKTIRLFKEREVSGILVGGMDFSDEISACMVPEAFPGLPVLLFATEETTEIPLPTMNVQTSDSFCGTLSIASGLYRRKTPFLFHGVCNPEDAPFIAAVDNFVRVCAIVKDFRGAYVGQIGPRPPAFETCSVDEQILLSRFGIRVVPVDTQRLLPAAQELQDDDPEVAGIIQTVKEEADTSAVPPERLSTMAKIEVVVKHWIDDRLLAGAGVGFGCPPYIQGRLIDQGTMMAFEVDILGSLTMLMQYSASLKTKTPFLMDWTLKHVERKNVFLCWHVGNAPPSMAEGQVILDQRGMPHFKLKQGEVRLNRIVEYDGQFKMLIAKGNVLSEGSYEQARFTWGWVQVEDLANLYRTIGSQGFIHHAGMIYGDYSQAIKDACYFLGIEVVET